MQKKLTMISQQRIVLKVEWILTLMISAWYLHAQENTYVNKTRSITFTNQLYSIEITDIGTSWKDIKKDTRV